MTTFDTAFHDTKRVVSSWTNISKFQAITIVRDVKGQILFIWSLLLDKP